MIKKNEKELAFLIAQLYEGQKEIPGSKHNSFVIDCGKATTLRPNDDETPWCSDFMNFCILQGCLIKNTGLMTRKMSLKLMDKDIKCMIEYALKHCEQLELIEESNFIKSKDWTSNKNQLSNGYDFHEPTYSALAASWKEWGANTDEPQVGDLVVFKRRPDGSGSGHISFFTGFSGNINRTVYCFGGNQNNSVCYSNYELDRVVTFRTI